MADPYKVLGVAKTASEAEIKKAFRALAKKHHPDTKGGDAAAQKKFQEISAAYDIVGDKEKRAKFDRGEIDEQGNPKGFDPRAQGFNQGFEGSPFGGAQSFRWSTSGGETAEGFSAEDIFADLFGGGLGGGGRRRAAARRGEDYQLSITVSFDEAARGSSRRVTMPDGKAIDVRIPVGLKDGQQIRLRGQGGEGRNNGPPGDLLLHVTVSPHPFYTRDGNDLRMDLPVTLKEAVLGAKVPVPTLTGVVQLTIPPNANSGTVMRLKGKGIQAHGTAGGGEPAGDLYVRVTITLPDKPDAELKRFAEGWSADYDPRGKLR